MHLLFHILGKILDTRVEDPDSGNPITFEKYMEKANDGDERYPLTGAWFGCCWYIIWQLF